MNAALIMLMFQVLRVPPVGLQYRKWDEYTGGSWSGERTQPKLTPKQRNARLVSQMESLGLTLADYTDAELAAMGYTHDQGLD